MTKKTSRKKERRASVGAMAHQALMSKNHASPEEIVAESANGFNEDLEWCVRHALGKEDCKDIPLHNNCKRYDGDFFIEVFISNDVILNNVIKSSMVSRETCPTPNYDQIVYHYHANSGDLEYLWNVPSKAECIEIINYRQEAALPENEPELLQNVVDFFDETLLAKAKKLNGEVMEAGLALEKKKSVHKSVDTSSIII